MRLSERTFKYIKDLATRDYIVSREDEPDATYPIDSGNYDDTYDWGMTDGETCLAQQLLLMLQQDNPDSPLTN